MEDKEKVLESGDAKVTIEDMRQAVIAFRDARDWKQFHNAKDLIIALNVEAAELLELCLFRTNEEMGSRERFAEEMADVLSYLLTLSDCLNVDLSKALAAKMKINAKHYPVEKAKGSRLKYTEL